MEDYTRILVLLEYYILFLINDITFCLVRSGLYLFMEQTCLFIQKKELLSYGHEVSRENYLVPLPSATQVHSGQQHR